MKLKITYWIATGLLSLVYIGGGIFYLTSPEMVQGMYAALGYPAYLILPLAIAKLAGAAAILSRVNVRLSDLAYAGMFFHLILAISAHINAADGGFVPALVALIALIVSFQLQNVARKDPSTSVVPMGAVAA